MQSVRKDQIVFLGDIQYRVVRQLDKLHVQLENVNTGELEKFSGYELEEAYVQGRLKTKSEKRREARARAKDPQPVRMDHMSPAAQSETRRRMDYVVQLEKRDSFGKARKNLRKDLAMIAQLRGEPRPPHETTVYRWRRRYLQAQKDVSALFSAIDQRGGKGQCRLNPAVEGLIDDVIDEEYRAHRAGSAQDVHDALRRAIDTANLSRSSSEQLTLPSLRTINRRLAQLCSFDVAAALYGQREAKRRHAFYGKARSVDRILEIVEIDHTPVDLLVADESRVTIGRPTLTVVFDRASRCVLGYHLSLAGHGTYAVFSALRHAMLPKTYLNKLYADLTLDWPCCGWPERILVDNGLEFHADSVRDAMANLGVLVEYAGSRDPNDKPFVERFLRTFNYTFIHKLPGTTLSNVHERIGFKAEEEACLTLAELDRMIHVWICNVYHRRPHRGLHGQAPIDAWNEGAKAFPPQLKMNREDVDIEFSQFDERSLHQYGIEINTFCYALPRLATLRAVLPQKTKVEVKWPHDDAGHIWVWDPLANEYFAVPNKDPQYAGLTVAQAQAAKKRKEQDPDYQRTNADAKAINKETLTKAMADKQLQKRRRGARQANTTSNALREPRTLPTMQEAPVPTPARRSRRTFPVKVEIPVAEEN